MDRTDQWKQQNVWNLKQLISILHGSFTQLQNGYNTIAFLIAVLWESNELRLFPFLETTNQESLTRQ